MNILQKVSFPIAKSTYFFSISSCYPKAALIAIRSFAENSSKSKPPKSLHPLHDAVKKGDVVRVRQILKTEIVEVNALDAKGKLPLGIAMKKYLRKKSYPIEILELLHDYGACYILNDAKGKSPSDFLLKSRKPIKRSEFNVRVNSLVHLTSGCGLLVNRCNNCKKESKNYNAEFKAKVSLESLSTSTTINELAKKHSVEPWEVIKWRWQAREGLVNLFKEKPSDSNKKYD